MNYEPARHVMSPNKQTHAHISRWGVECFQDV